MLAGVSVCDLEVVSLVNTINRPAAAQRHSFDRAIGLEADFCVVGEAGDIVGADLAVDGH